MTINPQFVTGFTLIEKALDFKTLCPNPAEWNYQSLKSNEPRLVRLEQIDSLIQVFLPEIYQPNDLKSGIEAIFSGEFIESRKTEIYADLFLKMDKLIKERSSYGSIRDFDWDSLMFNYQQLMEFKSRIWRVQKFNSGTMEISYPYLYQYLLAERIGQSIETEELDHFLSLVIDPENRSFTVQELVKNHHYPEENLMDVDMDWM